MTLKELARVRALEIKTGVEFEKEAAAFLAPLVAKLGPLAVKALPALKGLAAKSLPFLKSLGGKAAGGLKTIPGKAFRAVKSIPGKVKNMGWGGAANTALIGSSFIPVGGRKAAKPAMRQVSQQTSRMPMHHVRTY